jgi:hypothetical protein
MYKAAENPKLNVGISIEDYFSQIDQIMQNRASDIEEIEDNCGSWIERES